MYTYIVVLHDRVAEAQSSEPDIAAPDGEVLHRSENRRVVRVTAAAARALAGHPAVRYMQRVQVGGEVPPLPSSPTAVAKAVAADAWGPRPTLVMTIEGDTCVGSGRSITTIDLHGALESVADLFTHFGGHEFACGFSLEARNLDALRARLHALFETFDEDLFRREARIDATLTLAEIDAEFLAAHEMLQPFGAGNAQPLFLVHGVTVTGTRTFAEDCCELALKDATGTATAVLWPSVKGLDVVSGAVDLLVKVEPDRYRGVRLEVVDARRAGFSPPYTG